MPTPSNEGDNGGSVPQDTEQERTAQQRTGGSLSPKALRQIAALIEASVDKLNGKGKTRKQPYSDSPDDKSSSTSSSSDTKRRHRRSHKKDKQESLE